MKRFQSISRHIVMTVVALSLALLPFGATVSAAPVDVLKQCNADSRVCAGTNGNTISTIVERVVNLLIYLIGIISVLMIIIGGIRYTTSAGDSSQTKSARDTIIYAVVGLAISIMSYAIVNFVLTRI
ncbi:MAG TPA: hypothetical protein VF597_01530 [Candidatus Saccharimonadales bacterium]|jgi:hypothetical protein